MGTAAAIGGGALLGGIVGSQGTGPDIGSPDRFERQAGGLASRQLGELEELIEARGTGVEAQRRAVQSQQDLASQIQDIISRGGVATGEQRAQAQRLLQPQQVAFEQQLEQSRQQVAREAAAQGRTTTDPILRAKLAQEAARGQERIGAQVAQTAQGLQSQQLQLQQQLATVRGGLASQALQNRQTLLNLGSQLQQQQRSGRFRGAQLEAQGSPGGFQGFVTGAVGGATAGGNFLSGLNTLQSQLNNTDNQQPQNTSFVNNLGAPQPGQGFAGPQIQNFSSIGGF